jgi:hypothetical protein
MKAFTLSAVAFISLMPVVSLAQVKTYILTETNQTQQIEIKTNEIVQVLFHYKIAEFKFGVNGVEATFDVSTIAPMAATDLDKLTLPVIAGPATITVSVVPTGPFGGFQNGIFTIKTSLQIGTLTPLSTVVIPSDANGQVNVILESSTNMVSWTGALPGTYGRSAQARFFRVRAEYLE